MLHHWVKLDNGLTVSYSVYDPAQSSYYDKVSHAWVTADPQMIDEARAKLIAGGYIKDRPIPSTALLEPALPEPPKPKRKELMREIANLKETIAGLEKQLATENRRVYEQRMGELEHHLTTLNYEAHLYRKILKMLDKGNSEFKPRELFYSYFHKDLYETDVELSPEEAAKVFFDNK